MSSRKFAQKTLENLEDVGKRLGFCELKPYNYRGK
jgi:hypothetical protein